MEPIKPVAHTLMILVILSKVGAQASAGSPLASVTNGCSFPNTSMISLTACTESDFASSVSGLFPCLDYLVEDDAAPTLKCCAGVKSVSTLHPPCLCSVTFYPPAGINATRQKLMPGLCNVTSDLCTACPVFLVDRVEEDNTPSGDQITLYKKKVIGLAVVLGLIMACVVVGVGLIVRRKCMDRKTKLQTKPRLQSRQPGSDY